MKLVESVRGRKFAVGLSSEQLLHIQAGTLKNRYKGLRFCKNPFDVILYMQLLEHLRPSTIIEIGTSEGGSAVWFRDMCQALGLNTRILTFDISPPADLIEPGIHVGHVDSYDPDGTLPTGLFSTFPHPWLVIDDSAHTYESVLAVLRYFNRLVQPGDYVVVEDGVVADLPGAQYEQYEDGPNRAVKAFLEETGDKYVIDEKRCDFFGPNLTYCPNAWLTVT